MIKTIPISDILIEDRQRVDLGDLEADFASVKEIGLIQPIVLENVGKTNRLIAGGRRLAWLKANGYDTLYHGITCDPKRPGFVLASELNDLARAESELYENLKRHNLSWQEECKAVARIHRMRWLHDKSSAVEWTQTHTAHLLGIKDKAKVGYTLQVADELEARPDGELSKKENFTAAIRWLNEVAEREARKEQDKRRALQLEQEKKEQPELPTLGDLPLENAIPAEDSTHITVQLSRMVFLGDFNRIARDQLAPGLFPVAIAFDPGMTWIQETHRLLKQDAVCFWCHRDPRFLQTEPTFGIGETSFRTLGWPVIWNILDRPVNPELPFLNNQYHITVLLKGNPLFPNPAPTSIVSASDYDGGYVPFSVLEFLLHATTLNGGSVLLPCGGQVGFVARLGRRPVVFTEDREVYDGYISRLTSYYKELYKDEVTFA